jgi:hypothetical protein
MRGAALAARYPPDTIRLGSTTDSGSSIMSAPAAAAAAPAARFPCSIIQYLAAALLRVTAISSERALRLESTALTIIGVFHILAPLFMLRASFMSGVASASSACPRGIEQLAAGGDDRLAIIGVLVSTLQAIG